MKIYEVLIEYTVSSLDRPFSYVYNGDKNVPILGRVVVNFNNKEIYGVVINVIDSNETQEEYTQRTGFVLKEIIDVIDETPLLNKELDYLSKEVAEYYFASRISVFFAMLPPSLKPSLSSKNQPGIAYNTYLIPVDNVNYDNLTTRQAEALYRLIEAKKLRKNELTPTMVNALINKNKAKLVKEEKNRLVIDEIDRIEHFKMNQEQQYAYDQILNSSQNTFLLEGVTGSGKTEIYLQLSSKMISQGKTVLVLVPEISLSYMMVKRFASRFEDIAILHSELTPGQRYDEYRKIARGEVNIVIGARSAIFAPLENIGLIIIDEEHSENYKQDDASPFYNAINVAKMRQKYYGAKLVLGSATPSLESKSRALKGVYGQLNLTKRYNNVALPNVKIIDMSNYNNILRGSPLISIPLKEAIQKNLDNKEQTILLVNRRGYSPYVSCRKCGHVIKCPSCQVALTYHYENNNLMCHHCGYEEKMVSECKKCGSDKIFKSGFGTEKVEIAVKELFPSARILRLDSDVAKKKSATPKILEAFSNQEADILIGTQIVSKGHDFPNVTLVGIVLADIGLAIPSFRASERTFSLITQAIGRSGRNKPGIALIQTYMPDNYVIQTASKQDYLSFYANEIRYRKLLQNPPYTYLSLLLLSGSDENDVRNTADEVTSYLKMHLENENNVSIIGPSEMFIKQFLNKYRMKIIIKYKDFSMIKKHLDYLRMIFNTKNNIKLTINVDPYEDY